MKDTSLLRWLWILLALTFPLFGVEFFRYNTASSRIHIAAPMMVLVVTVGVGLLAYLKRGSRIVHGPRVSDRRMMWLLILGYLFVIWHMVGVLQAKDSAVASREVYKIGLGLICFSVIVAFFPRDEDFLARFWTVAAWSTTVLLAYLIYESAFVYKAQYLISEVYERSNYAKNQLGGYMVYMFPFAVGYASTREQRILKWPPALILMIAMIYNSSRGNWVASAVGLLIAVGFVGKSLGRKRVLGMIGIVAVVVFASYVALESSVDVSRLEYHRRLQYFYDPDSVPEFDTWNSRSSRVMGALTEFTKSPIVGVGLGNTSIAMGTLPHNDYLLVLSELGVVGAGLLVSIIWIVLKSMKTVRAKTDLTWVEFAWRAGLIGELIFMLSMDRVYSSTIFWVFIGLSLVAAEIESQRAVLRPAAVPRGRSVRVAADRALRPGSHPKPAHQAFR